ncbi:MAG: PAS domain-containing protein [Anaerolineae bacterium]|nr:PAS domain-containing protein [Anaerolineae bacterium]
MNILKHSQQPELVSPLLDQLQAELLLHDRAMAASSCGITIADARLPDMPLIYINDAFERITGYSGAEVLGKNCRFLQGSEPDQPVLLELRAAIREGRQCEILLRNYRKDGTFFWNALFMAPIYDENSLLTHFIGVQTDVTDREEARRAFETTLAELRETQMMLVHSEKMNALGQMVAGVAHEINNPTAFVSSNLHNLGRSFDDIHAAYEQLEALAKDHSTEVVLDKIARIRQEKDLEELFVDVDDLISASIQGLGRVKKIVTELRTFSRLDEAELKLVNLAECIRSTLTIAEAQLKNRVEVLLEIDHLPDIVCYPAELNQVFLNLILNAAQAIDGSGQLAIRGVDAGAELILEFADTGTGISPEVLDKIFNPFFTTKPIGVGTGLGLSIAYKIIVDRHQGKIEVSSTPGTGSIFTIHLPKGLKS